MLRFIKKLYNIYKEKNNIYTVKLIKESYLSRNKKT